MKIYTIKNFQTENAPIQIDLKGSELICVYQEKKYKWNTNNLFNELRFSSDNFSVQFFATSSRILKPIHLSPTRMNNPVELIKENSESVLGKLFVLLFNGKNDFCVASWTQKIISETCEIVEVDDNPTKYVETKIYPGFIPNSKNYDRKRKLLFKLDCNDSLSGNEKQVDMLTKIVKVLATHYTEEIQAEFPEYAEFFEAVDDTSTLTQDTAEDCIANMRKHKQFIRNAVEEYRSDKNK